MKKRCTIIGSGLAGSVLANELANDCDVAVLEIGSKNSISYPAAIYPNKRLAYIETFCHGSGGSTNLWHNGLIPIDPDDVSAAPFKQVLDDSGHYIDRAASQLHYPGKSYSDDYSELRESSRSLGEQIGEFSDGVDTLIYPKKYSPLKLDAAVDSYFDVSDITFEMTGSGVKSLTFKAGGETRLLRTDFLVFSCGTLGTPILLRRLFEEMGCEENSIGNGLIDHPMGFVGKFRFPKSIAENVQKFALSDNAAYEYRSAVRLKSECGKYTACAFFRPTITMNNDLQTYVYKSLLGASTGKERLKNALSLRIFHPDIVAEIVSHLFPVNVPTRTFAVLLMGEQRERRGRVSGTDISPTVDWSISDQELEIYSSMVDKLRGMLTESADEAVVNTDLSTEWLWSGAHHSGTTFMDNDGHGSVNTNLRVNGLDNVFVCDASVIQEHSYANTGLTIGQLACRLADYIGKA